MDYQVHSTVGRTKGKRFVFACVYLHIPYVHMACVLFVDLWMVPVLLLESTLRVPHSGFA